MKNSFYKIVVLVFSLFATASQAATINAFSMNAGAGSTGTITAHYYGQKNVTLVNGTVTQINGKNKTELFSGVTDLSSSVTGLSNNAPGTFSIAASVWNEWDSIYIGLKQSDAFALFLLTKSVLGGTWQTPSGNSGKVGTGLSHYVAFGGTPAAPNPVPVPAAVWLFASGLAGLLKLKRK